MFLSARPACYCGLRIFRPLFVFNENGVGGVGVILYLCRSIFDVVENNESAEEYEGLDNGEAGR